MCPVAIVCLLTSDSDLSLVRFPDLKNKTSADSRSLSVIPKYFRPAELSTVWRQNHLHVWQKTTHHLTQVKDLILLCSSYCRIRKYLVNGSKFDPFTVLFSRYEWELHWKNNVLKVRLHVILVTLLTWIICWDRCIYSLWLGSRCRSPTFLSLDQRKVTVLEIFFNILIMNEN